MCDGLVWAYVPFSLIAPDLKPLFRSKLIAKQWYNFSYPNLMKIVLNKGFGEVDLLYVDSIYQPFWLKEISYKKSILRIHDKTSAFLGFSKSLKEVEHEIATSVDSVVYSAKSLERYVNELTPRQSLYVPNGVNFTFFQNAPRIKPSEYRSIKRPIAIYVGAMGQWFDFDLINTIIPLLPDISFVFIGPDNIAQKKIKKASNVHILGPKKIKDLPAYLYNSDIGIIPFNTKKHKELINTVNPLKLYEYMACGLPVVSVEWDELRLIESPAKLCKTSDEFVRALRDRVMNPQDKVSFQEYAKLHDWSESFKNMMGNIGM